ncbi:hypothetical protein AHMF7605_11480 [Adhaeribacter arboris]|uniref:Uncharacterized protein n=1 Tax=Adhaeribacter arboris TaxID=2072846 RepID=A0A2T2YF59_9BACT|nr:hypothetical protein [Adhaeribacter arboris]PSR54098.1 hypothetical protein AHMF7605_11480 [Adhaeribacter arboris]
MSYDLMVFQKNAAPLRKKDFMAWYENQTQWTEDHGYDDPENTSAELRNWYVEMQGRFPDLNGPNANDPTENPNETDYSIGRKIIYAAFSWSQAESAYQKTTELAAKYKLGFFDASGSSAIWIPDGNGKLKILKESEPKPWWKFW